MVLSREEIEDIQQEEFANDVPFDYETLKDWDEEQEREFFERGGDPSLEKTLGAFYTALNSIDSTITARLLALQDDAPPLTEDEANAVTKLFTKLTPPQRGDPSCCRFILTAALRSLSSVDANDDALLNAHFGFIAPSALSSEPAIRIDLGSLWCGVMGQPENDPNPREMAGSVGVLLLGFGGSSLASMVGLEKVYAEQWPQWLRLTHAGPLLLKPECVISPGDVGDAIDGWEAVRSCELPPTQKALDGLLRGVTVCERLIVHIQSNQGHMIWTHLLRRSRGLLQQKVKAMVYDCAAAQRAFFDEQVGAEIEGKSVMATLKGFDVVLPVKCKPLLERGSRLKHSERIREDINFDPLEGLALGDSAFDWQIAQDLNVPTLCITSEEDTVIQAAGVRAFAERLQKAQPSRKVSVLTLKGAHVAVGVTDRVNYSAAIAELVGPAVPP